MPSGSRWIDKFDVANDGYGIGEHAHEWVMGGGEGYVEWVTGGTVIVTTKIEFLDALTQRKSGDIVYDEAILQRYADASDDYKAWPLLVNIFDVENNQFSIASEVNH